MPIHIKPANKGKLHRDLGVPQGEPIPEAKLAKAKHSSNPAERKRATFAENAKHWNHGGRVGRSKGTLRPRMSGIAHHPEHKKV